VKRGETPRPKHFREPASEGPAEVDGVLCGALTYNPQFTDDGGEYRDLETIYAMLLTHDKYRRPTDKAIADTAKTSAKGGAQRRYGRGEPH
jgi:hypothetical protein